MGLSTCRSILRLSAKATLAGRALDVDVFVHALDMAHGGINAGRDCVNLHLNRVQTAVQC